MFYKKIQSKEPLKLWNLKRTDNKREGRMEGGVERVKIILPKANPSQSDQCAWNRLTCPNSVTDCRWGIFFLSRKLKGNFLMEVIQIYFRRYDAVSEGVFYLWHFIVWLMGSGQPYCWGVQGSAVGCSVPCSRVSPQSWRWKKALVIHSKIKMAW